MSTYKIAGIKKLVVNMTVLENGLPNTTSFLSTTTTGSLDFMSSEIYRRYIIEKVKKAWRESVHEIREFIRHEQEVKIAEQAKEDMGEMAKQIMMGDKPTYRK